MMPVEIVVRDYLAGTTSTSILQMYKKGSREMYGHRFPEGLRDNQKLPQTIITPTTTSMTSTAAIRTDPCRANWPGPAGGSGA